MLFKTGSFLFFLSLYSSLTFAQKEPVEFTVGVEFRSLQNFGVLNVDSVVLVDPGQNFRAVYGNSGGFGFGGVVRARLTPFWNIETGIYYTARRFDFNISDASEGFRDELSFRVVGYEIPLKGLVYIQLGENIYANVALGISADFFASDVEAIRELYDIVVFKNSWVRAAALGSLGFEYRTEEDGYFYLGGSFHQPFGNIMETQVNYRRNGSRPAFFRNGTLDGAYFSIDFRYFFPVKKERKSNVKYVKPDWKNM